MEEFPLNIQNRLKMLDKNFVQLTTFFESHLIPTTNNAVENYFFRTLNMDWKKRMKTDMGLIRHLKLQTIRILGIFSDVTIKIPDLFCAIRGLTG